MNFLCHAMPYFDTPLMAAATAVPDWLRVIDRSIRARSKMAEKVLQSEDPVLREDTELRAVAQGVIRHHSDDQWFHGTQAFAETNMQLAIQLRDQLPDDEGFRPTFVGHILVEMLLDAFWMRDDRSIVDRYYETLESVSAATIQRCVNTITGKPTDRLAATIARFVEVKFFIRLPGFREAVLADQSSLGAGTIASLARICRRLATQGRQLGRISPTTVAHTS